MSFFGSKHMRMFLGLVWMLLRLTVVSANNQSILLVHIDSASHPQKLIYQTWIRPDLMEQGEWKSLDGSANCIEEYATNAEIVETTDAQMPPHFFTRYPDIDTFKMTHKHLKFIESFDLLNASSLLRLNVSHNEITSIADFAFEPAPKLTEIDLSFNLLHDLNENVFTSYLIKYLYLHNNQLTVVNPKWFENLLYLRILTLNNNRIRSIDWAILEFWPNINVLHLHSNEIAEMHNNVQTPRSMQTFSIHDNPVAVASHDFIWLDATVVDVQNTSLHVCRITQRMSMLIAANNEIRKINLDNLSGTTQNSLVTLHLANNQLQSIANVTHFHRLKYLDASYNALETVESEVFATMKDLKHLDLSHNKIKRFDLKDNRMPHLRVLDVSFNEMLTLHLGNILSKLQLLNTDGNRLQTTDVVRKARHAVNHESLCINDDIACHENEHEPNDEHSIEPHLSDELQNFIYEQFHIMESNILQLIDAKFQDIQRRVSRLEQEMIVITTNRPDIDD